jgi:hypothetical protein
MKIHDVRRNFSHFAHSTIQDKARVSEAVSQLRVVVWGAHVSSHLILRFLACEDEASFAKIYPMTKAMT